MPLVFGQRGTVTHIIVTHARKHFTNGGNVGQTERKILQIQKEHALFSKSHLTFSMLHCGREWAYLSIACCTCLAQKLNCQSCRELWGLTEAARCNPSCPHLKPAQAFEQTQAEPMAWLMAKSRHWGEPFEPRNQREEMSADKASAKIDSVLNDLWYFIRARLSFHYSNVI